MMQEENRIWESCLQEAYKGRFLCAPNPMVGAAVYHRGEKIGCGWHKQFGAPHAERAALDSVENQSKLKDSELFVTLEPCCHEGKTPPCTERIIASGIPKVHIACFDPSPELWSKGMRELQEAGIAVSFAASEIQQRAVFLNRRFFCAREQKRPYVILKWAETADGFLAREDYSSKWISGESSRGLVHEWRAQEQSIVVGTNTVRYDDPLLTARPENLEVDAFRQPLRLVIDRELQLESSRKVFNENAETLRISAVSADERLEEKVLQLPFDEYLERNICDALLERDIHSLFVEGGSYCLKRFLRHKLWDEIRVFRSKERFGTGIAAPEIPLFQDHLETSSGKDSLSIYFRKKTPGACLEYL